MPDDINNLDTKEEGLKGIFGSRFQDLSEASAERKEKVTVNTTQSGKVAQKPTEKPMEYAEPALCFMEKLKDAAKRVLSFAVLNLLIFYWQQKGLMAESIALPCMIACAVLAGYGIAKLGGD
jgi:hypothetical protein